MIEDSDNYAYQIESVNVEGDDLVVKGWFFELKKVRNTEQKVTGNKKTGIVIYDINSQIEKDMDGIEKPKKGISLKVQYVDRYDINEYFKCEYDYSKCGFIARTDKHNIDMIDGEYQIIIKPEEDGVNGISSNAFIDKGKLQYVNPKEYVILSKDDEDCSQITSQGTCLVSLPAYHMYVYQYGWNLYWITDDHYNFDVTGNTIIQFQISTTQFDRLPTDRVQNAVFWGNESDSFEKYEITKDGNLKYRISVRSIPKDYAVVRILTGFYENNKWVWRKEFRPIYKEYFKN